MPFPVEFPLPHQDVSVLSPEEAMEVVKARYPRMDPEYKVAVLESDSEESGEDNMDESAMEDDGDE